MKIIGQYGASLSLIEVGLGSLLHSFHVPFSGVILSLNQGYILCRASLIGKQNQIGENEFLPYSISNIAAFLKSLAPAGKKLGPMLSLSMQGLLFNFGSLIFGANFFGLLTGMLLLSLWSFIQPLVTYYLFFGNNLLSSADYLFKKTIPFLGLQYTDLVKIFVLIVVLKLISAFIITLIAFKLPGNNLYTIKIENKLLELAADKKPTKEMDPIRGSLKDLCRPLFLVSIAMTGAFLFLSENDLGKVGWYLMRPVAIGFLFFYISRTLTLDYYLKKMRGGRFDGFSKSLEVALVVIRKYV